MIFHILIDTVIDYNVLHKWHGNKYRKKHVKLKKNLTKYGFQIHALDFVIETF